MKAPLALLPLLSLAALPAVADEADAAFSTAIRAILPPAKVAEMKAQTPAAPAVEESTPAAPAAEKLSFTPDLAPAADTSPAAHPAAFNEFKEKLRKQAELNLYDFTPAMTVVLDATHDELAAETWMQKAAQDGCSAAQQYMGDIALNFIPADKMLSPEAKAGYALLRQAADAGYDPAKINVYMCLLYGIGVPKDEKAAAAYIMQACKSGTPIPRFKWLQSTGRLDTFEDKDRPEVKAEIDRGNHHVLLLLSKQAPDTQTQLEWLQKAAAAGNPEALFYLSSVLSTSDPKQSFRLLAEAIAKHHAQAMFVLGDLLLEGDPNGPAMKLNGLKHDDVNGRKLIKLAALSGSPAADYWLGRACFDGTFGMPQSYDRAYKHFEHGARTANPACCMAQGIMLLRGLGTAKDERRGLYYLNNAANAGRADAVCLLAYAVYNGIQVEADAAKAAQMLQEAASMDFPDAYIYLAYITAKGGKGLPADEKQAEKYLRMAELDVTDEGKAAMRELYARLLKDGWVPLP